MKFEDDKILTNEIIKYLNNLAEDDRKDELNNLDNVLTTSETIYERTQQIVKLSEKGENYLNK